MLVQIHDREALSSLSVFCITSYLNSHGWINQGQWGSRPAIIYTKEDSGMNWEVLVPTRDTIADYSQSMARSVAVVAEAENRSQLDVFYDLSATGADVIQMRASSAVLEEPLSLRESAGLLNDAYNMLAASARSVENPRPAYRGKMSVEVANYLDSVRPLPNDYRGYALTLHSPVPVGFERQEDLGDEFRTPFSRQATYKLAQGLKHASSAIERTFVDYTLDPFEKGVDYGLSANFCDSVAELALKSHGVEISLAWAGVRPASMPNSHFKFTPASADVLKEAAKSFRTRVPTYNEQIVGHVVQLKKELNEFDGQATILSLWDGRLTRMSVEFEPSVYTLVIIAFRDQTAVSLDADVHPSGSGYTLANPRNLCVLSEG